MDWVDKTFARLLTYLMKG